MKIAYLANVRFPSERAHSVQIVHMCNAFSLCNAEVTLFANKRNNDSLEEIAKHFSLDLTFKLERLPHGIFWHAFKPAYYFSELYFSLSFLFTKKHNSFDFIYSRHEWIIWFLSLFIKPDKLVWESHEAKLNFPARNVLKKGIKTVTISEGISEDYEKYGVEHRQILVAHDGIDESFFANIETKETARKRLGLPAQGRIAMYIGGFDEWKGVETFFASTDFLENISVVAIGGNPEQIADLLKLYSKVTFLGQLPYGDLKNNQQGADVLVIPNSAKTELSARYTSPLKLFAHMASGVPIVASDIPSLTTVTGSKLITLSAPDSPEALAEGIQLVFTDYEAKKDKAQELKEVSLGYTWNKRAQCIINFISLK